MKYVEERTFTLRLEIRCEFPDDYDGEEDGYEWAKEIPGVAGEIVQAAAAAGRRNGWTVRPANRGRPAEEEVTLLLERVAGR
ncbi:MAG TPA: hypothetical protein VN914_05925 [Polyangia bacterium]|nr:hypothetical protein [Polyangia bacterium]